jgi:flavin-dependent dehydrogenase
VIQQNTSNNRYDVVVVGGGPAGAAAATFLQRRGYSSLVLESSSFPRYHIGESLIPHTFGTLDRLGLLPTLRNSNFPEKYSVRFISPTGQESEPFYFSETLAGEEARTWQVQRSDFDQMCLDNARDNGVTIQTETRVERVLFEGSRAVGLIAKSSTRGLEEISARVVIDASGRATVIGSQLGLKEGVDGLKKAALWSYYRGGQRGDGIDAGETTVFMISDRGWFWYIPLPDDVVSVGVVAAPEYLFTDSNDFEHVFLREVERCAPLSARLKQATRIEPVRGLRRLAYRNRCIAGDGWVMVGDAAAFLDPIYSSGLYLALASAELAADCVHQSLESGDLSAARLGAFAPRLGAGIEVIWRLINAFYDPNFSFRNFVERFPEHRAALIDCLIGDVINKDMRPFLDALAIVTPAPPQLISQDQ